MPPAALPPGLPSRRFGVRTLLLSAAFVLVAVPFLLLLLLVRDNSSALASLDAGARDSLHGYAVDHPAFVTAMEVVSFTGNSTTWWTVFVLIALWLLWRRLPRLATFVVLTALLSSLLNSVVKELVDRARPVLPDPVSHANGLSFPSGHAQAAVVGYGILILVFLPALREPWRRVAIAGAALMVLTIGFSRVALGVHYMSDVAAGYILGLAWLVAMTAVFSAWRQERGLPPVQLREGLEPDQADLIALDHPTRPTAAPPQ